MNGSVRRKIIVIIILPLLFTTTTIAAVDSPEMLEMPDLVISMLTVTSVETDEMVYHFTITNIGNAPADMDGPTDADHDNLSTQGVLSNDLIYGNGDDSAAGGGVLGSSPLGYLDPGESINWYRNPGTFVNPCTMNYLLVKVDQHDYVDEWDENNNVTAAPIHCSFIYLPIIGED